MGYMMKRKENIKWFQFSLEGAALIAFRLLIKLSKKAKRLAELELSGSLHQNAQ